MSNKDEKTRNENALYDLLHDVYRPDKRFLTKEM